MKAMQIVLTAICLVMIASGSQGAPPQSHGDFGPNRQFPHYLHEHPQHRLAWWYAGESMRQTEAARHMMCGFTGQRWTLDRDVHYRWALRANPTRVYREVEQRDRHLARCRSNKLREFRRAPPG